VSTGGSGKNLSNFGVDVKPVKKLYEKDDRAVENQLYDNIQEHHLTCYGEVHRPCDESGDFRCSAIVKATTPAG